MKIKKTAIILSIYIVYFPNAFAQNKKNLTTTTSTIVVIPTVEENYYYDPTNKRDPFKPFNLASTPEPKEGSAITSYSLGQLKLTAVAVSPSGERKAIVEDSQGRGYTISVGSHIGKEGGQVIEIEANKLIIETTKIDFTGKEHKSVEELKLNLRGPAGQIKPQENNAKKSKK